MRVTAVQPTLSLLLQAPRSVFLFYLAFSCLFLLYLILFDPDCQLLIPGGSSPEEPDVKVTDHHRRQGEGDTDLHKICEGHFMSVLFQEPHRRDVG